MPWSWPVVVNQLEAKAFCNWKSAATEKTIRLPSEDEWYALRRLGERSAGAAVDQPDWAVAPGNINLEHFASECPVDKFEFQVLESWRHFLCRVTFMPPVCFV